MIKQAILIIIGCITLFACGESAAYRIQGKVTHLEDQTVYVFFQGDNSNKVEVVECDKPGQFSIEQNQYGPFNSATLLFENKTIWVTVYLEEGQKITVSGDVEYPALMQIKGGKINNELTAFRKKIGSLLREQADLYHSLNSYATEENAIDENDVTARLANVNHQISEQVYEYIQANPNEEASVVLLEEYFTDPDDTRKLDELLALLDPQLSNFYLVKELEQFSERAKRTALGAEAPEFTVKNVYGKPVSLDSFPEKYLLLTFTAPWCDMCQTENLFLDEIIQKYPKEQLDMLLVSLDDDMEGVKDVLKRDSIQWNLVTDSAGQASMLLDLYNVSALPRSFLIDEQGKIILKTENGTEIKQTIEKLLDEEKE